MTVSSGYFIQQMIPALLLKAEILHQEMTSSAMKANTDSLINQQLPLKSPSRNLLNTAAKSGLLVGTSTPRYRPDRPSVRQLNNMPPYKTQG